MASLEEALFTELKNDAQLATLLADGSKFAIYYDDVPEGKLDTLDNMVVITRITEDEIHYVDYQITNMQISCISKTKSSAISLKDGIIRVLTRFRGNLGGKRKIQSTKKINSSSLRTSDSKSYMEILDFSFNHFGDNV